MDRIVFGIVGGGWRADFYLRIAQAIPGRFAVTAMLVRDEEKGKALEAKWGVKTYRNLDGFVKHGDFGFAVVSIPRRAAPSYIQGLTQHGIPVLTETPPANELQDLIELHQSLGKQAKVQVAEQYLFQPMHAARIAFARSGKLGEISQVQISAAHGYHGISLIRQLLGIGFENAEIRGQRFESPLVQGPDRSGPPREEAIKISVQDIVTLRFGNKLALFDFTGDQYFSWIRKNRILVRGHKGEMTDEEIRYLEDYRTPVYSEFRRVDTGHNGNLEGYSHKGVLAGNDWVYCNPFFPGRLSDDEIAVATSLEKMGVYVQGGPSFYGLAEAMQDHYLSLMMAQAIETGKVVTTTTQPWAY